MRIKRFLLLPLILLGCHKSQDNLAVTRIEIDEVAQEQQIPKALMGQIDEELKEEFKTTPPLYSFMPLTVAFKQDQNGVLKNPITEFSFPKGGGALDMKDFVTGEGSFYMYFPA